MKKRARTSRWARSFQRSLVALTRAATASGTRMVAKTLRTARAERAPPAGAGEWIPGVVFGATGACNYRLYCPPGVGFRERVPLMVMLHGCGQDADGFAASTRMNRVAMRERFLVLYPEQARLANAQRCWNWFETRSGRAHGEATLILRAIDQVCLLYPVDRAQVAIAGLSAGASMAALVVTQHPARFRALVMHSGIPPGAAHSPLSALAAMQGRRSTRALAAAPNAVAAAWPPLLVIHGAADIVVSPENGRAAARVWAAASGARPSEPRVVRRGKRYPMSITDFKLRGSTMATLVEVDELAHAWSGGAAGKSFGDEQGPDASRMAWTFAARQFRDPV